MSNSIANLSSFTGLSEVELAKRAQDLVSTGKIKALNTLDAQLLASMGAGNLSAQDAISATAAQTKQAHVIEEPAQTLARSTSGTGGDVGFKGAVVSATPDLASSTSPALLDKAATSGGIKVRGFAKETGSIIDSLAQNEQDIMTNFRKEDGTSRDLKFEEMKRQAQKMTEIFTALSNVLANIHETQKTAIGNLRA